MCFCFSRFVSELSVSSCYFFQKAVEVLWTPQEDKDTLTADELLRDYPTLNML